MRRSPLLMAGFHVLWPSARGSAERRVTTGWQRSRPAHGRRPPLGARRGPPRSEGGLGLPLAGWIERSISVPAAGAEEGGEQCGGGGGGGEAEKVVVSVVFMVVSFAVVDVNRTGLVPRAGDAEEGGEQCAGGGEGDEPSEVGGEYGLHGGLLSGG